MTLLIYAGNRENTILLSDLRLSFGSQLVDDASGKAALLVCQDARILVGFAGLAADFGRGAFRGLPPAGRFRTLPWLLETLAEAGRSDGLLAATIDHFAALATQRFEKLPLPHPQKPLVVVFAGYQYDSSGAPRTFWCTVSNFAEDRFSSVPTFSIGEEPPPRGVTNYLLAAGAYRSVNAQAMIELGTLVDGLKSQSAIVGKAVEVLRAAAASPAAANSISSDCVSAVLPSRPELTAQSEFHSAKASNRLLGISSVDVRPGHGLMVLDPSITFGADLTGRPAVVSLPKVGRNKPCPCGSGLKFKRCHGRS